MHTPSDVHQEYLNNVHANNLTKKRKMAPAQTSLSTYYESIYLTPERQKSIEKAMIQAFVCAEIPFRVIDNPFFIEFLKQLRPAYELSFRKVLSGCLLDIEISRVNSRVQNILQKEDNLTLGKNF